MDAGILPVKRLDRAKGRLAQGFGDADRLAIARALVEDALALCSATGFLTWWVVSDDDDVLAAASGRGLGAVRDRGAGLNDALALGLEHAAAQGARSVTMIPADIPLATPEDVADLVDTGATSEVVVVPSARDGGTNGLYVRPPGLMAPSFGANSLAAHMATAQGRGLRCSVLAVGRMELDIDTPADVDLLLGAGSSCRTAAVAAGLRSTAS